MAVLRVARLLRLLMTPWTVPVGTTANGAMKHVDVSQAPHVLLCGTSGSGKSVGVHALVAGLVQAGTPRDTQLIILDPKRVEFRIWEACPHVACVVTDRADMVKAVLDTCKAMDDRYARMERLGVVDMPAGMPRLFLVCDELADLTMASRDKQANLQSAQVLGGLTRIAQLGRSAGVHLIVATQRPAADTLPGNLRANLGTRWAFRVRTRAESRIALDAPGAEALGQAPGSSLLSWRGAPGEAIQALFVSRSDIERVVSEARAVHGRVRVPRRPSNGFGGRSGRAGRLPGSVAVGLAVVIWICLMVLVMTGHGFGGGN